MWWVAEGEKRDAAEHGPRECRQLLALVFPCANGILTEKSRYTELPSRAMGWGRAGCGRHFDSPDRWSRANGGRGARVA